jgi:hypothetical protein
LHPFTGKNKPLIKHQFCLLSSKQLFFTHPICVNKFFQTTNSCNELI